jgi:hypothetical protein
VAYLCRQAKWIGAWIQWMLKLWLQYSCESRSRSSHVWTGTILIFYRCSWRTSSKDNSKVYLKTKIQKDRAKFVFLKTFNNLVEQ